MIDFKVLEKLLALLEDSEANTIEVKKGWWSTTMKVSKSPIGSGGGAVTYQVANSSNPSAASPAGEGSAAVEAPPSDDLEIQSPMVGTFYARPEPGAEPYVRKGSRITPGKTLCIIEAMKIMNPVDAEISGVIVETLVEDAQPVEFGQVLFRVDPHG
ncbi:MAG: acetyl-CoA carboxylase biotin carboxyl carrier protein [Gemmatimonadales bacterium]